jgi:hypothetical protein
MTPRHKAMAVMALAVLTIAPEGCESLGGPPSGDKSKAIEITTITTGQDIDPDGYLVEVCQGQCWRWHVAANGKRTHLFFGGPYGDHTVELGAALRPATEYDGRVASNCVVSGDNPRVVGIHSMDPPSAGTTLARTTFEIHCTALPPEQP